MEMHIVMSNNRLLLLVFIVFVLLSFSSWTIASSVQPVAKEIFILAGQSNMAGRGGVFNGSWNGTVPPENSPDPLRVFRLNTNLTWEVARDPLHQDIDVNKTNGVGPGMSFANAVKGYLGSPIGLVPCATGGSAIEEWARGKSYYVNMVERAKAATICGSKIKALLWYQGESDTDTDEKVNAYRENMNNLILNVREDLNLTCLPVIQVAIASGPRGTNPIRVEKIRDIQRSIELPYVSWVDAKGLELYDDESRVHLTTESQVKLGLMLAKEYLDKFATKTKLPSRRSSSCCRFVNCHH